LHLLPSYPAVSVYPCDRHMGPIAAPRARYLTLLGCKALRPRGVPPPACPVTFCHTGAPPGIHGDKYLPSLRFRSPGPARKHTSLCSAACLSCTKMHLVVIVMGVGGHMDVYGDRAPSETGIGFTRTVGVQFGDASTCTPVHD
jgi:hypothetical protein